MEMNFPKLDMAICYVIDDLADLRCQKTLMP